MSNVFWCIATGITIGTLARYLMMRRDVRQYPSYPHAVVNHLSLGFLAATLGAVAIPALAAEEYTAVTFLALAATQFREVRSMERQMLVALDTSKLVPCGKDFIEGIARTFEARNYLVLFIAMLTSGVTFWQGSVLGIIAGVIAVAILWKLISGKAIKGIAKVRAGEFRFEKFNLFIEDIHIMNVGLERTRKIYKERAKAVVLEPFNDNAREILANVGQRQAIAHDAAALLGIYRDVDTAEFTPLLRRNIDTGRIGMIILPLEPDTECLLHAVQNVPVLESAVAKPLASRAGRCAAD